ncbi:MAG: SDR family oxidoreductase [Candidatus Marinimicrobia bacterium]|nr:SDR family oxidoreductase [Candidatus Neomarinimicrobiota bacterium]
MLGIFDLKGKTALVTGCSRGIGHACAIGLARAGASIIGVSKSGKLDDTAREITTIGGKFTGHRCDFLNRDAVYTFIKTVLSEITPDILINNAGTILRAPAVEHSNEYWDNVIEVNLNSQFIISREFGRKMVERGGGKIVFITSLLSFQGGITVPGYAASKGGIRTLTMALSNEWADKGVNVNAIAPGYIATDNTAALQADQLRNRAILERIPTGRWGTPEDLVGAVVFLSSSASSYINGITIPVDGGWLGR